MRNIRLNAVRRRLMATSAGELSVSTAAVDAGFDHLGHFAGNYKQLFGELPSLTARASAARDR
jgi:transcriptional regulator GlxA family with amidase domain